MSSVQDGIYALGKANMRSTPSLRRFPNIAFETVPMFVCWHTMALSHLFEDYDMCGPTVTYWGDLAEGKGDLFHLHRQAGGWDRIGCTVFMDGSRTLLDSEAPTWLVFCDGAISVHCEVLRFAVFLNEKLDLWPFCLLAVLDTAYPCFLARVSHRDAGIGLGTFPTPWFAWALSTGILALWWSFPGLGIGLKKQSVQSSGT